MSKEYSYYEILGVSRVATLAEIKKAYRIRAKETHPDKAPGCKVSEELFKLVVEAYRVLSNPELRREYDRKRRKKVGSSLSLNDFYTDLGAEFVKERVKMEVVPLRLSIGEAFYGCEREILYTMPLLCDDCEGTGAKDGKIRKCPLCEGEGCQKCEGEGYFYIAQCETCEGEGRRGIAACDVVSLPGGISEGNKITFSTEEGVEVLLDISVDNDTEFVKHDDNLYYRMEVSMKDMLLGGTFELDRFGETLIVEVPPMTKHKDTIVLKGGGFSKINSEEKGNLIVEFSMVYPEMNEITRKIIQSL